MIEGDLQPGADGDGIMAEMVMGWYSMPLEFDGGGAAPCWFIHGDETFARLARTWHPTTSTDEAMEVATRLASWGHKKVELEFYGTNEVYARFSGFEFIGKGESPAIAICRAAYAIAKARK